MDETRARIAECHALAGRAEAARAAARETFVRVRREAGQSVLAAQLDRTLAWAALLEGRPDHAAVHVAASLRDARALSAAFEVALTLNTAAALPGRSQADGARDRAEAALILDGLGVVSVPAVPGGGDVPGVPPERAP